MIIHLKCPEFVNEKGLLKESTYVRYVVETIRPQQIDSICEEGNFDSITTVKRRYSDFQWLYEQLAKKYPHIIIPPMPENRWVGNTDPTFVNQRMEQLRSFINSVANHPKLCSSEDLLVFLDVGDDNFARLKNARAEGFQSMNESLVIREFLSTSSQRKEAHNAAEDHPRVVQDISSVSVTMNFAWNSFSSGVNYLVGREQEKIDIVVPYQEEVSVVEASLTKSRDATAALLQKAEQIVQLQADAWSDINACGNALVALSALNTTVLKGPLFQNLGQSFISSARLTNGETSHAEKSSRPLPARKKVDGLSLSMQETTINPCGSSIGEMLNERIKEQEAFFESIDLNSAVGTIPPDATSNDGHQVSQSSMCSSSSEESHQCERVSVGVTAHRKEIIQQQGAVGVNEASNIGITESSQPQLLPHFTEASTLFHAFGNGLNHVCYNSKDQLDQSQDKLLHPLRYEVEKIGAAFQVLHNRNRCVLMYQNAHKSYQKNKSQMSDKASDDASTFSQKREIEETVKNDYDWYMNCERDVKIFGESIQSEMLNFKKDKAHSLLAMCIDYARCQQAFHQRNSKELRELLTALQSGDLKKYEKK